MQAIPSHMTVADYCNAMARGEIIVNRTYQRSDKVWPAVAKAYLIETVLLQLPVPKLSLHQVTDLRSRKTIKQIVDGQQRSVALQEFFEGRLRLSNGLETTEAAGRLYEDLDEELKQRFLDYNLDFDLFVSATDEEVREVFRRMNSFTVPLNPEEQRHAVWQGHFKWFIHRLARKYDEAFLQIGVFSPNQLIRMADTKLLTEIVHAYLFGITTTTRKKLDDLYRSRDVSFSEEDQLNHRLTEALDQVLSWDAIHRTALMRPYVAYSLILAVMHVRHSISPLETAFPSPQVSTFDDSIVLPKLTTLSDALESPESSLEAEQFVKAASEKTNVAAANNPLSMAL